MIKAVLIDDEKNALEMLEWQLQNYCPQIQIAALCRTAVEGIDAIRLHQPQLLFLDIEMPGRNGFNVLQAFPEPGFDVIFTTAYDQFALKAIKFAALDYLLKPIDADDLLQAIQRFEKREQQQQFTQKLDLLLQQYQQPAMLPGKIAFATGEGILFIKPTEILRCESSSNYTNIYFENGTRLVVSKTLKEVEELLQPYGFYRVHHSHLVNPHFVKRFIKTDGGTLEMTDGVQVAVSRQRKDEILKVLMSK